MTRRNLSDVLRQEVTKDAEEAAPNAASKSEATPAAQKAASRASKSVAPSAVPAVVDQSAQLAELKAALAQGAEQEKALQSKIRSLEVSVKQQQTQIKALEKDLETQSGQAANLKTELTEAKDVILQLSEANTQMSQTLDELKKPPQRTKAKAPLAVRPLPRHSIQLKPSENIDPPKTIDVGWMD